MTQQLSLSTGVLPEAFVQAFRELEQKHARTVVTLAAGEVLRDRFGRWWLEVSTPRGTFALMNRTDLEAAARDLFSQVHGA